MSSIESMSGLSGELTQLRQLLARQGGTSSLAQTGAGRGNDSRRAEMEAKFNAAALAAGLDPSAVDGLQDEMQSAIAAATQNSSGTSDQQSTVQAAVDGVLQKHGVDLTKFKSQMQATMGGPGSPPPDASSAGDSQRADFEASFTEAAVAAGLDVGAADGLQDEIKSTIDQVLTKADSKADPRQAIQDAIDALLKGHGVDLEKFKSQLQSRTGTSQGMVPLVDEQA